MREIISSHCYILIKFDLKNFLEYIKRVKKLEFEIKGELSYPRWCSIEKISFLILNREKNLPIRVQRREKYEDQNGRLMAWSFEQPNFKPLERIDNSNNFFWFHSIFIETSRISKDTSSTIYDSKESFRKIQFSSLNKSYDSAESTELKIN